MPFLIKCPDLIKAGTVSKELIMNIDFGPTLLDFAGIKIPQNIQGKSFKNTFSDSSYIGRDAVYYHYYEYPIWHKVQPHYGMKTSKYKLIHFYYSMDEWELYDLETDPNEVNNIYNKVPASLILSLKKQLKSLQSEYKDDISINKMKSMTDTVIRRIYNEPSKILNKFLFKNYLKKSN
jgi:arylsulfatase A-like enzyme